MHACSALQDLRPNGRILCVFSRTRGVKEKVRFVEGIPYAECTHRHQIDSFATKLMEKIAVWNSEIPVVHCDNRSALRNPSIADLVPCLDLNIYTDKSVRDVVVIRAGSAGLAETVYAASEGLKTLGI